ncbi:MAG: hypothetical protein ACKO0Z_25620 [Betaproteobacteria bacterium]
MNASEAEQAREVGRLQAEVENNKTSNTRLWDAMNKQSESIKQLERSIDSLRGVVERLAEAQSTQTTDRQKFQQEIKDDIARLDGEIKQELELLKEDLQARRTIIKFLGSIARNWAVLVGVVAAIGYWGYVTLTGHLPPGKP